VHEALAADRDFRARFGREVAAARMVSGAFTDHRQGRDVRGPARPTHSAERRPADRSDPRSVGPVAPCRPGNRRISGNRGRPGGRRAGIVRRSDLRRAEESSEHRIQCRTVQLNVTGTKKDSKGVRLVPGDQPHLPRRPRQRNVECRQPVHRIVKPGLPRPGWEAMFVHMVRGPETGVDDPPEVLAASPPAGASAMGRNDGRRASVGDRLTRCPTKVLRDSRLGGCPTTSSR
jgi:hypothetical protein